MDFLKRWGLYLSVGALLAGCVPQAFELSDYKKHLTAAERSELAAGHTITKIHASYWRFHPTQLYWQGPLRVQPLAGGKLKFTIFGHWLQYDERGNLLQEATYRATSMGIVSHDRIYYPAGVLHSTSDSWPTVLNGDSVLQERLVYFRGGKETDTAYVETLWEKDGRATGPATRSFDWQGKRPVPKNWHYQP